MKSLIKLVKLANQFESKIEKEAGILDFFRKSPWEEGKGESHQILSPSGSEDYYQMLMSSIDEAIYFLNKECIDKIGETIKDDVGRSIPKWIHKINKPKNFNAKMLKQAVKMCKQYSELQSLIVPWLDNLDSHSTIAGEIQSRWKKGSKEQNLEDLKLIEKILEAYRSKLFATRHDDLRKEKELQARKKNEI
jgi:hypothetical protein